MWSPATHVVILKDPATHDSFMATTCKVYLIRNWDTTWSQIVLELLDLFTKTVTAVERMQPSIFRTIHSTLSTASLGLGVSAATASIFSPFMAIGLGVGVAGAAIAAWNSTTRAGFPEMNSARISDMDVTGKKVIIFENKALSANGST